MEKYSDFVLLLKIEEDYMKYKDYYEILGVSRDATEAQIKSAYRKAARKYHPDVNKDPSAVDKFKDINEAYEVLSDKEKRSRYDSLGANWQDGSNFTPPPGFENFNFGGNAYSQGFSDLGGFSDFFGTIFGDLMGGGKSRQKTSFNFNDFGGFSNAGRQAHYSGAKNDRQKPENLDITREITISAKDLMSDEPKVIKFNNMQKCPSCSGNSGYCSTCGGTGFVNKTKNINVKIPKGIKEGQKIRLAGEGNADRFGNKGNLYLEVKIQDSEYEISGSDVTKQISVTPAEAVIGTKKEVETLHGKIGIKIPPMTKSGTKMRLKELGLPKKSAGYGNLNLKIQIDIPQNITPQQKKLYEELLKTEK